MEAVSLRSSFMKPNSSPEADNVKKVLLYCRIVQVQAGQLKMSLPDLVSKGITAGTLPVKIYTLVPVLVGRIPSLFTYILKSKKFTASVVEHAVHHDLDAAFVAEGDECFKGVIVAQTPVNQLIIPCIVAMAGGFKQWPYVDGIAAQGTDVGNP